MLLELELHSLSLLLSHLVSFLFKQAVSFLLSSVVLEKAWEQLLF